MNDCSVANAYGVLSEPATLTIERVLPGPIERVWAYLTDSELRRQWLAAGAMELTVGAPFELVWRNDELTTPPGRRPAGIGAEHRMRSRIIAADPPRRLVFAWGESGEVSFVLEPVGDEVRLTLVHRRVPDRDTLLKVSAGWHMHLDTLVARASGREP
ncbi:MAG: SRPBCC family protein, partial [Acetobacteraceae bacterium]|nr:SRPBCC family protein [Acetobacteraceae bacterium]